MSAPSAGRPSASSIVKVVRDISANGFPTVTATSRSSTVTVPPSKATAIPSVVSPVTVYTYSSARLYIPSGIMAAWTLKGPTPIASPLFKDKSCNVTSYSEGLADTKLT